MPASLTGQDSESAAAAATDTPAAIPDAGDATQGLHSEQAGGAAAAGPADTPTETPPGDQQAAPPAADKGEGPKDLLSAVRMAVQPKAEGAADAPAAKSESKTEKADAKPEAEKATEAAADDPDKLLPFHNHPRWKQVIAERNDWRAKAEQNAEAAQSIEAIKSYMTQHSLEDREVQEGFAIMAAMKTNPAKAWELLQPHLAALRQVLGEGDLPTDLREKVDDGRVDEETAREIARARAARDWNNQAAAAQNARRTEEAQQAAVNAMVNATDTWVAAQRSKDPDFDLKAPLLRGAILDSRNEWIRAKGRAPATADEAVEITQAAYKSVTDALRRSRPRPQVQHVPSGPSSTAGPVSAPKTLLEAVTRAVKRPAAA